MTRIEYELITDGPKIDRQSLLQRSFSPLTAGGIRQSMFTLISAAIGGGILCLPYVLSLVGVILGVGILTVASVLAYISMRMLLLAAERQRIFSYGKLFSVSMNMRYAGPFLDVVTILFGQGVVIAYFVFLGDFVPALGDALGLSVSRTVSILLCCCCAVPLIIPSRLSALKYITPISTISLIVTAMAVVYRTPSMVTASSGDIEYVMISRSLLKAFAIAVSSFICHTNVVAVAGELVYPTERRADKIASRCASVQLFLYLVIAVCGYLSFSSGIEQNFLRGYPDDDSLIASCRVLLSFTIFFGLPLNSNPAAKALVNLLQSLRESKCDPLLPATPSNSDDPMRNVRIVGGTLVLVIGAIVSLKVPGIADVIGILGGSLGTLIMLVFPALIYQKVYRDEMHLFRNRFQVGLLLFAAAICFSSVVIAFLSV